MSGRGPGPGADALSALRGCRLLRAASDEGIARLGALASIRRLKRGQILVREGDPADGFGIVVVGKLAVYHLGADGKKLLFETMEATQPVAAVAALAAGRYPAYVEATTPAVVAWLARSAILDLMAEEPGLARSIVADFADRLLHFTAVATTLARDVPARVAHYVFERALAGGKPTTEGLVVDLGMSKTDLASSLGTVPETLSRAFAKLKSEGLVEVRGKDVVVLDFGGLTRRGEGYAD